MIDRSAAAEREPRLRALFVRMGVQKIGQTQPGWLFR
jgi:hypothetical protein